MMSQRRSARLPVFGFFTTNMASIRLVSIAIAIHSISRCSAFLQRYSLRSNPYSSKIFARNNDENRRKDEFVGPGDEIASRKKRTAQLNAIICPKKALVKKRKDGEAASAAMDLPEQPLVRTIRGGQSLIFEAARQSLRRWHPTVGVADVNPNFRTEPPMMTSQGYAASIWKNARKRQPAMWRYAMRTYDRLLEQRKGTTGPKLELTTMHFEGALTAAAKLGWSGRAIQIYKFVEEQEDRTRERLQPSIKQKRIGIAMTENMVLSVIRACVRESGKKKTRAPLDAARQLVEAVEEVHFIPVTALHLNPIAAAYQSLGLHNEANALLLTNLGDRIGGPEAEDDMDNSFNVYDVQAKDKGSYSLLVSSAVSNQDWAGAIDALKTMTEAGLYPANRHLNTWAEISEKKRNAAMRDSSSSVRFQRKPTGIEQAAEKPSQG